MKIIKRSGKEVDFDQNKITNAIIKANLTVDENEQLTEKQIAKIVDDITKLCKKHAAPLRLRKFKIWLNVP